MKELDSKLDKSVTDVLFWLNKCSHRQIQLLRSSQCYRRFCDQFEYPDSSGVGGDGSDTRGQKRYGLLWPVLVAIFLLPVVWLRLYTPEGLSWILLSWQGIPIDEEQCTIPTPSLLFEITRPIVDCGLCRDVTKVDRVEGISPDEFEDHYAYTGRPVVVVDGAKNWTALNIFSFLYFRQLYSNIDQEESQSSCQFFPYKTEFQSLQEALEMSEQRANMSSGENPWYIGWSNCDSEVSVELRSHYERPYFLPETSESSRTDWIFMGTPGNGANMHVDDVQYPSWQAQILGVKRWYLKPPLECRYVCQEMSTEIAPGQIIVIDTNMWYHKTEVTSKSLSITIGSEYD